MTGLGDLFGDELRAALEAIAEVRRTRRPSTVTVGDFGGYGRMHASQQTIAWETWRGEGEAVKSGTVPLARQADEPVLAADDEEDEPVVDDEDHPEFTESEPLAASLIAAPAPPMADDTDDDIAAPGRLCGNMLKAVLRAVAAVRATGRLAVEFVGDAHASASPVAAPGRISWHASDEAGDLEGTVPRALPAGGDPLDGIIFEAEAADDDEAGDADDEAFDGDDDDEEAAGVVAVVDHAAAERAKAAVREREIYASHGLDGLLDLTTEQRAMLHDRLERNIAQKNAMFLLKFPRSTEDEIRLLHRAREQCHSAFMRSGGSDRLIHLTQLQLHEIGQ